MTISIESSVATYTGNGVLTVFDVKDGANGIYFAAASELVVTIDGVLRTLTTHYTVSGAGTAAGQVTFLTAPANGTEVRIRRDTPRVQELDLSQGSTYDPASVETQLDRIVRAVQDVGWLAENPDQVDVTITVGTVTTGSPGSSVIVAVTEDPDGTFEFDFTIPRGDTGASGAGTGDVVGPASATPDAIALYNGGTGKIIKDSTYLITAAGAALIDDANAAAQRTTLGLGALATLATVGTAQIDNDAVTYAKMQNVSAADRLLGRGNGGGAGDTQEIALGTGLSMTGTTLNAAALFTVSYTSSNQTITSGGSLTLAHGLGAMPKLVQTRLICTTAELGYSINDELMADNVGAWNGASFGGHLLVVDATNVNVRFGSAATVYAVGRKDTGAAASLTNANWALRVRAWA